MWKNTNRSQRRYGMDVKTKNIENRVWEYFLLHLETVFSHIFRRWVFTQSGNTWKWRDETFECEHEDTYNDNDNEYTSDNDHEYTSVRLCGCMYDYWRRGTPPWRMVRSPLGPLFICLFPSSSWTRFSIKNSAVLTQFWGPVTVTILMERTVSA